MIILLCFSSFFFLIVSVWDEAAARRPAGGWRSPIEQGTARAGVRRRDAIDLATDTAAGAGAADDDIGGAHRRRTRITACSVPARQQHN